MKEIIVIAIALCLYFMISYFVYEWLQKVKTFSFLLISLAYLSFTNLFLYLVFRFDQYISISVWHEGSAYINEVVMAAFFVCTVTAIINIIAAMASNEKKKEKSVGSNQQLASN